MVLVNTKRPSLESAKRYLYETLDFSMLKKKLMHESYIGNRWFEDDLEIGITLYKNFLYLCCKYYGDAARPIIPTTEIDEIWHNHILDTERYHVDCDHIFGEYFHHYPYLGMDEVSNETDLYDAFQESQKLYFKEFEHYY